MAQADPDLVAALREALMLAERGEMRAIAVAALSDTGEPLRVICAQSEDIAGLLGTMTLVEHALVRAADCEDDEDDGDDDAAASRALFGPSRGDA